MPFKDKEKRSESNRRYYQKNKDKINERKKRNKTIRLTALGTSSGMVHGLRKRPYPIDSKCELCNQTKTRLSYHHWDEDLNKGIWICWYCHCFAERMEDGYEKYLELLKRKVELEMPGHMERSKKILKKSVIIQLLNMDMDIKNIAKAVGANRDYVYQVKYDIEFTRTKCR